MSAAIVYEQIHDYTVAHGCGEPTPMGMAFGWEMFLAGETYADIAFEIVARGMTQESAQ